MRATHRFQLMRADGLSMQRLVIVTLLGMVMAAPAMGITWRHDRNDLDNPVAPSSRKHEKFGSSSSNVGQFASDVGFCSGTLIKEPGRSKKGSRWVLTAGHCLDDVGNMMFTIRGKQYTARRWISHPRWAGSAANIGVDTNDIALVQLTERVWKKGPAKLYGKGNKSEIGRTVKLVGFGLSGDGQTGSINFLDGVRRGAYNVIDAVGQREAGRGNTVLFTTFNAPNVPPFAFPLTDFNAEQPLQWEGDTASGDSGGALFIGGKVAGVTSYGPVGSQYALSELDRAGYTRVRVYKKWINDTIRQTENGNPPDGFGSPGNPINGGLRQQQGLLMAPLGGVAANLNFGRLEYRMAYLDTLGGVSVPVPEPASAVLLGLGAVALLKRRRHC